jgi:hypothetical protein
MTAILNSIRNFWRRLKSSRAEIEDLYPDERP